MHEDIQEQINRLDQEVARLYEQGQYEQAVPIATRAYDLARQHLGEEHPEVAYSLDSLAGLYAALGEDVAAESLYQQALTIRRKALGEEHPELAYSLDNLAGLYAARGEYATAELFYQQAITLRRRALGDEHPDVAYSLDNLANMYEAMGDYPEAESLYKSTLELRRQVLGNEHLDVADSLDNLARQYQLTSNYTAAESLYQNALALRRKLLGDGHLDVAYSLDNLAMLYHAMGKYTAAKSLYQEALIITSDVLGEDDPEVAYTLRNFASLYQSMGDYMGAEVLYRHALTLVQEAMGDEHPDVAFILRGLARLYADMGNYADALVRYQQALTIVRNALGDDDLDVAHNLEDLANLYVSIGNYAAAEALYRQALTIVQDVLGDDHPSVTHSLENLARLYENMDKYAAAEALYQQALTIVRNALGDDHADVATVLNSLASLYVEMGDYVAAEPLHQRALELRRQSLGETHPNAIGSLNNLADLSRKMGNYGEAEQLYLQALANWRSTLDENHPNIAYSLFNLGRLYAEMSNQTAAESYYQQALTVFRRALGDSHPNVATNLTDLAVLYAATQRGTEALVLMEEAVEIDAQMISQVFSVGSESQRMAYLSAIENRLHILLSLISQPEITDSKTAAQLGVDNILRRKALGAEALAAQRDTVLGGHYPHLVPQLSKLSTLRTQIAQTTLAGPGPEGVETHQQRLAEWNALKEQLEAELARQIPEIKLEEQLRATDREIVADALPEDTVLIEFVRFNLFDFSVGFVSGESEGHTAHYLAFILPATSNTVEMVDLGKAKSIDEMIAAFRRQVTGQADHRHLTHVSTQSPPGPVTNSGEILRAAVFDPLLPALDGYQQLFIAPDGDLTRLPFEVLPTEIGRYLIDDYHISYLSTGRDLLRLGRTPPGKQTVPLVVADPDFDLGSHGATGVEKGGGPRGRQSRDLDRGAQRFGRLPGTRVEGEAVAAMLDVQPLLEGAALETRLKTCQSPHILHIATHGFFLEDQKRDPNEERRQLEPAGWQAGSEMDRLLGQRLENPLLRSGLALAGANTWLQKKPLPPEAEDGILTAEDVSGLDLLDTELVVLSACETGLGEVQVGEGVFGLRRAFVLAGAKTLVMSLWKVPDQQTQELMVDFYQRILKGQSSAEALREAQLAMKEKHADPFYWGAFICQGDPGPLTRHTL